MPPHMTLDGKVIIVTGASRGIGRAAACLLAERGGHVVLAGRDESALQEVSRSIESRKGVGLAVPTDVCLESSVKTLVNQAVSRFGRIDVLVNNAGVCVYGPVTRTTLDEWEQVMGTNVKGVFLCTREVIPVMIQQGAGHIVTVASQAGKFGFPNLAIYCASKFGVIGFSESLERELIPHNIKVTYLCPGYVDTELLKAFPAEIVKNTGMTTPEEVADQLFKLIVNPRLKESHPSILKKIIWRMVSRWMPSGLV
jgi:3-oxoacyl-[acyl-carrier protein] reductase